MDSSISQLIFINRPKSTEVLFPPLQKGDNCSALIFAFSDAILYSKAGCFYYAEMHISRKGTQSRILPALFDEIHLKIFRFYAIISVEKQTEAPVMRRRELHKRLPISKTISKIFLDKFLDTGMLYGTGFFRGSNKKEPKTLVNTGVSASFIVFYYRAKSVIF